MKHNILLLITLLALCLPVSAQSYDEEHEDESFSLSNTLNKDKSYRYTASGRIDFIEGFNYKPEKGKKALFEVKPMGVYPPESGVTTSYGNENVTVSSIDGFLDVGSLGGALYTVPVEIPSGVNGMQPSLAIVYNSQAGNGLLGYGWELSGISSITRTGSTLFHDGKMTAADFSSDDRFLLDGQRLIRSDKSGDTVIFKTEQDIFARILYYGTGSQSGFKVMNADGTIAVYGGTADSKLVAQNSDNVIEWKISSLCDRNGNTVTYHYANSRETGEINIDYIEYTSNANAGIEPEFKVEFVYVDRIDRHHYYIAGNIVQYNKLLAEIVIDRGDDQICSYSFDYDYKDNYVTNQGYDAMFCKLSRIWCKKGGRFAVPITIGRTFGNDNTVDKKKTNEAVFDGCTFPCNLNNDGFTDVILVPYISSGPIKVFINKAGHFDGTPDYTMARPENLVWIHVADMNDDGIDEVIIHAAVPGNNNGNYNHPKKSILTVYEFRSGVGFIDRESIEIKKYGAALRIGDFLGDGTTSCIIFKLVSQTSPIYDKWVEGSPIFLYYDKSDKEYHTADMDDIGIHRGNILADDFTGDGKTDLMVLDRETVSAEKSCIYDVSPSYTFTQIMDITEQTHYASLWRTAYSGDMNGDGKADLIYQHDNMRYMDVLFSEGTCFSSRKTIGCVDALIAFPKVELYDYDLNNPGEFSMSYSFLDIDSDGKSDFMAYGPHGVTFYRDLTESRAHYGNDYEFGKVNTINENVFYISSKYLSTGNFVKNGSISFVCRHFNNMTHKYTYYTAYFHSVSDTYSVSSIDNGFDGKLAFEYDFLMPDGSGFYQKTAYPMTNGLRSVSLPMLALKNRTQSYLGENGDRYKSTSYRYTNAIYHKTGHGLIGFSNVVTCDSIDGETVMMKSSRYETYTMGYNALLLPSRDTTYVFNDGKKICSETNCYEFDPVRCSRQSTSHDNRLYIVRPAIKSQKTKTYDPDAAGAFMAMEVTEYSYNYKNDSTYTYSYNCDVEQKYSGTNPDLSLDNCDFNTKNEYDFFDDDYSCWVINRVRQRTTSSQLSNKPVITDKVKYEYSSGNTFLVSDMTAIPSSHDDDSLVVKTHYEYDSVGNVTRQTLSAPNAKRGETPKDVLYEYGSGKRLVKTKTTDPDGLKYSESYGYDEYDMVISTTASSGLVTTSKSDNPLGSTVRVINPDGTESVEALRWKTGNEYAPEGSTYYRWNKSTGGVTTWTFYHKTGVPLRTITKDENEKPTIVDMEYDTRGRLKRQSTPYRDEGDIRWTEYEYDDLGRPTVVTVPDGTKTSTSYSGFKTTTTVETPDGETHTTSQTVNSLGWIVESVDAEGAKVAYDYYSDGKLKTATTSSGKVKLSVEYDNAGNRRSLEDPDYGKTTSVYNAYGQLMEQVSPKGNRTTYTYDELGRMTSKCDVAEGMTTDYTYNEKESKGALEKVSHNNDIKEFSYDEFLRPVTIKETIAGVSYVTTLAYDEASRVCRKVFPSGYELNYKFYVSGRKHSVLDSQDNVLWHTDEVNAMGQLVKATTGNGAVICNTFDPETHRLTENNVSKNIQDFVYHYDKFGNLAARKDSINNVEETFTYDNIDRLTGVTLTGVTHNEMTYDNAGRMVGKQMDGKNVFYEARFSGAKPHAMVKATTTQKTFPEDDQKIDYTSFDKVRKIVQGDNTVTYTYGIDNQRVCMTEVASDDRRTKIYVGNCEFIKDNGVEKVLTYLTGPYGVFAVVEKVGSEETIHYIYADHLGSWTAITDSVGNVEQRQSFDAWGNRRDATTWQGASTDEPLFDRGFTGHEHLYNFGLINMNGRMYDPLTSSFLSPDNYVQDPTSQQSFNRYAYCFYNPLKYIDPSGESCFGPSEAEKVQRAMNEARQRCWNELWRVNEMYDWMYQKNKSCYDPFFHGKGKGTANYNSHYGGFYNSNGRYLGSNGRCDGKVYIICDGQLSRPEYRATVRFIIGNSGNADAFTDDCLAYSNSIEITSYENRQAMWAIVQQDNGMGGKYECNNREYGGYIDCDGVHEMPAGDVCDPKFDSPGIYLPNGYSRFHSHPSGDYYEYEHLSGKYITEYYDYDNVPSKADITNAGLYGNDKFIHYVFGRSTDCVYIYNYNGIQAVMKTNIFLKLKP